VYGLELAREMIEVANQQISKSANQQVDEAGEPRGDAVGFADAPSEIRVSGYVGAPGLHRANRGYITLFVNRRWFQDTSIGYSVIQAYHTLLPTGRYPVAVIFIEIDPAEVDVNVHPTKAEVRFRETSRVYAAVQRAVRRALVDHAPIPQVSLGGAMPEGAPPTWTSGDGGQATPFGGPAWAERRDALLNAGAGQARLFAGGDLGQESGVRTPIGRESGVRSQGAGDGAPALLPLLRVVGQLGATYVICEGPDGLYLIDQHAAHERVLYEQFLAERAAQKLAIQPLLEPLVLDLSPEQAAVAAEELGTLAELGIAIEPFGGSSYLVRSLPAILSKDTPQAAVIEIVDGLAQADDVVGATHEAALITLICKRAAVKGGQVLSLTEMQELVRRLEACRSPRTCPHGRPTMIHVSATELARQFGRQ
jgi:DNA mismatch repair protein MutL